MEESWLESFGYGECSELLVYDVYQERLLSRVERDLGCSLVGGRCVVGCTYVDKLEQCLIALFLRIAKDLGTLAANNYDHIHSK